MKEKPTKTQETKTNELKTNQVPIKKKSNELLIAFRLYNKTDIIRFEEWKKELEINGESVSNAISNVIRNYLLEKDKQIVLKSVREDLYYSLRKVMFSSLAPFSANIIKEVLKNRVEDVLLNKKMDVLLNNLINKTGRELNDISEKNLAEARYFEQMRELFIINNEKAIKKVNEKIANIKDRQKKFEEYEKQSLKLDSEILSETSDDEFEYDLDLNDLTITK
ncbi:integrative conjugal element protein [Mycoplasma mycoides subsp. capri]|uniref:Mbov_0398 family ICE element protein n=1 Tax=Mycoplasma mycoides TaxID=2102 RepID=UPI00223ED4CA|nr:integrative conjugal element protein [Mycoplasma mycoides]UZK63976.1 integrative conjugal element protein [Mycoplasma mycoides subsp. capri]